MHTMLPTALKGAVKASLAIDKAIFTSSLHNYELYYHTKSPLKLDTPQIKEFTSRTTKLVNMWLDYKGFQGTIDVEEYQFIKEHIIDWYGTKNIYGEQRLLASYVKLQFDTDIADYSLSSSDDAWDSEALGLHYVAESI